MKIRPAVQEDVREMMEIFNYEARNSTASFTITEQSYEERLAWFRSHGGERHPLIAAEQDGRVAGYACLSDYRPYEAYKGTAELSVYVSRDFRRRGIGEALMRELLDMARSLSLIHISLKANKFHTCRPRSVFCDVHAAAKNGLHFICRLRAANSARLF